MTLLCVLCLGDLAGDKNELCTYVHMEVSFCVLLCENFKVLCPLNLSRHALMLSNQLCHWPHYIL